MPIRGKRGRIVDESLNTYGFRMLVSGWMNRKAYEDNPLLLFNHIRAWGGNGAEEILPVGNVEEIQVNASDITGVPVFDSDEDDFAKKVGGKYERGVLRAFSPGIRIVETSEDPQLMLKGQTRATVTKWELREVSVVDIPSNKTCVTLYDKDGEIINLSDDGSDCPVPLIKLADHSKTTKAPIMEQLSIIAGFLGLSDDANLKDIQSSILKLTQKADLSDKLQAEVTSLKDAETKRLKDESTTILNDAVSAKKIKEEDRAKWARLFDNDFEATKELFDGLVKTETKEVRLKDIPKQSRKDAEKYDGMTFKEMQEKAPETLADLKANDFDTFKRLYESDYGKTYKA